VAEQATSTSRRLFFALWPAPEMQRRIADAMRGHIAASGGRAAPTRNLHVTLAFLGEVPEVRLVEVTACAERIRDAREFRLQFERVETWTGPRVLCMTTSTVPDALQALFDRLRAHLVSEGFEVRHEDYRPHVTLARHVRSAYDAPIEPTGWQVHEFVLVQSRRSQAGSEYEVLRRWAIG
jgi:2'-5' RNA ligase